MTELKGNCRYKIGGHIYTCDMTGERLIWKSETSIAPFGTNQMELLVGIGSAVEMPELFEKTILVRFNEAGLSAVDASVVAATRILVTNTRDASGAVANRTFEVTVKEVME